MSEISFKDVHDFAQEANLWLSLAVNCWLLLIGLTIALGGVSERDKLVADIVRTVRWIFSGAVAGGIAVLLFATPIWVVTGNFTLYIAGIDERYRVVEIVAFFGTILGLWWSIGRSLNTKTSS